MIGIARREIQHSAATGLRHAPNERYADGMTYNSAGWRNLGIGTSDGLISVVCSFVPASLAAVGTSLSGNVSEEIAGLEVAFEVCSGRHDSSTWDDRTGVTMLRVIVSAWEGVARVDPTKTGTGIEPRRAVAMTRELKLKIAVNDLELRGSRGAVAMLRVQHYNGGPEANLRGFEDE